MLYLNRNNMFDVMGGLGDKVSFCCTDSSRAGFCVLVNWQQRVRCICSDYLYLQKLTYHLTFCLSNNMMIYK